MSVSFFKQTLRALSLELVKGKCVQVSTQRRKKRTLLSHQCYHHRLCEVAKSCWVMFGFWHWMLFRHTKRSTWWLTLSIFLMLFFSFTNNLITTTFCNHKTTKKPNGKPQHTRPIFIKLSMKWLFYKLYNNIIDPRKITNCFINARISIQIQKIKIK